MELTYHPPQTDIESYYADVEGHVRYRRIAGGIGWPSGEQPGFGLVLSEDTARPPHYRVLAAVTDFNGLDLLAKCQALEMHYPVPGWHGQAKNRAMMLLLHAFNQGRSQAEKLKFLGAPLADWPNNSGYYLPRLIELAKVGVERISAGISPELVAELAAIQPETHLNRDIADFPSLAALCYPLAHLLSRSHIQPHAPIQLPRSKHAWML